MLALEDCAASRFEVNPPTGSRSRKRCGGSNRGASSVSSHRRQALGITVNTASTLALSGNDLYVSFPSSNTVGEYNAATGAPIAGFTSPSGLDDPAGVAVSGNDLYVVNDHGNTVGEFDATTGAAIAGFTSPSGLIYPVGIAIAPTPEPGSAALLALGTAALLVGRRPRSASFRRS